MGGGGGGLRPQDSSTYFIQIFHPNQPKHHLKWKLASLSACRVFEHHPKLHSFAARWRRSSLVWLTKFANFWDDNFWKIIIFYLLRQYVHQMKAENILNSNLASKMQFVMKKFAKNEFFKIFVSFLTAFFFRNSNFSKNLLYNHPFLWLPLVFNMKKGIYMKVRHSPPHCTQGGEPLKIPGA